MSRLTTLGLTPYNSQLIAGDYDRLPHWELERDVLIALNDKRSDHQRMEAALRLSRLHWLYRDKGLAKEDRATAMLLALLRAYELVNAMPRVQTGKNLRVTDTGDVFVPIALHGVHRARKHTVALPEGLDPRVYLPIHWHWVVFLRSYLPWAYRQELEDIGKMERPERRTIAVEGWRFDHLASPAPDPARVALPRVAASLMSKRDRAWAAFFTSGCGPADFPPENRAAAYKAHQRFLKHAAEFHDAILPHFEAAQGWTPGHSPAHLPKLQMQNNEDGRQSLRGMSDEYRRAVKLKMPNGKPASPRLDNYEMNEIRTQIQKMEALRAPTKERALRTLQVVTRDEFHTRVDAVESTLGAVLACVTEIADKLRERLPEDDERIATIDDFLASVLPKS